MLRGKKPACDEAQLCLFCGNSFLVPFARVSFSSGEMFEGVDWRSFLVKIGLPSLGEKRSLIVLVEGLFIREDTQFCPGVDSGHVF